MSTEEKTAAKKGAEKAAKELKELIDKGKDFATLAKKYSKSDTAEKGGIAPPFTRDSVYPKEFENAAFALKEGEISDPIEVHYGYYLIKRESNLPDFNEFKKEEILAKIENNKFEQLISDLRSKAKIIINHELLTDNSEADTEDDPEDTENDDKEIDD